MGRKQCLLTGLAIFFLGSLAASLAPNAISLIIFRAFCGIGGGGLMSIAQIIVGDVVQLRERGKYQGILGAVVAVANGVGPVIGGALAGAGPDSWRNIFRLNLPLCFLCAVCVIYFMPLRAVDGSWKAKVRAIDYVGAFLALGSTTAVVVSGAMRCERDGPCLTVSLPQLGLTWAGGEYGWASAHVLASLLTGAAVGVTFLLWEWKGAVLPLLPCECSGLCAFRCGRSLHPLGSAHLPQQDGLRRMHHHGGCASRQSAQSRLC